MNTALRDAVLQQVATPPIAREIVECTGKMRGKDYSAVELPSHPIALWEIRDLLMKHEGAQT